MTLFRSRSYKTKRATVFSVIDSLYFFSRRSGLTFNSAPSVESSYLSITIFGGVAKYILGGEVFLNL